MVKSEKFTEEWLLKHITPWGNGLTLKTKRPKDGIAGYVWRMAKYQSGIDINAPRNCFIYLTEQLYKDGIFENFHKPWFKQYYDSNKEFKENQQIWKKNKIQLDLLNLNKEMTILNKLDFLIWKCIKKLNLPNVALLNHYKRFILYGTGTAIHLD